MNRHTIIIATTLMLAVAPSIGSTQNHERKRKINPMISAHANRLDHTDKRNNDRISVLKARRIGEPRNSEEHLDYPDAYSEEDQYEEPDYSQDTSRYEQMIEDYEQDFKLWQQQQN